MHISSTRSSDMEVYKWSRLPGTAKEAKEYIKGLLKKNIIETIRQAEKKSIKLAYEEMEEKLIR